MNKNNVENVEVCNLDHKKCEMMENGSEIKTHSKTTMLKSTLWLATKFVICITY